MTLDPTRLACKEVVELVTELLGGALGPEERAVIEQHLFICPSCWGHLEQVKATAGMVAGLRSQAAADPALIELFRRWRGR